MTALTQITLASGASTDTGTFLTMDGVTGAAGTANTKVQTVQGIASMTPLLVNASGNAVPVTDNSGSLTVDNAGTFAVQATLAAGATNVAKAEDVASADADVGIPAMAIRKATPANTSGTDGDYEMLQVSAGRLWASTTLTDGTDTLLVDGHGSAQTTILDSSGSAVTFNANGQATMANSAPTVLASDMPAIKGYYVALPVSTTTTIQSSTGATGDFLDYIVVFPNSTAAGSIVIKDNATTIATYAGGGTTALLTLTPFTINIGAFSRSGAWSAVVGANVHAIAVGKFS